MTSEYGGAETYEEALNKAIENDCILIQSTPTQLLLDLDTLASTKQFFNYFPKAAEIFENFKQVLQWRSRNGNDHVLIPLQEEMPFRDRLVLQATLGSDPMKEMLSLNSFQSRGIQESCFLFKPKTGRVRLCDVNVDLFTPDFEDWRELMDKSRFETHQPVRI